MTSYISEFTNERLGQIPEPGRCVNMLDSRVHIPKKPSPSCMNEVTVVHKGPTKTTIALAESPTVCILFSDRIELTHPLQ
jgi:hypothetical protein